MLINPFAAVIIIKNVIKHLFIKKNYNMLITTIFRPIRHLGQHTNCTCHHASYLRHQSVFLHIFLAASTGVCSEIIDGRPQQNRRTAEVTQNDHDKASHKYDETESGSNTR